MNQLHASALFGMNQLHASALFGMNQLNSSALFGMNQLNSSALFGMTNSIHRNDFFWNDKLNSIGIKQLVQSESFGKNQF